MKLIDGKEFECIQCGKCCKWDGYVFLDDADIKKMSDSITDGDKEKFLNEYTENLDKGKYLVLGNKPNSKECVFLEDNKCSIYKDRPKQCRDFPVSFNPKCPGFEIGKEKPMDKMAKRVLEMNEKYSSTDFDKNVMNNLYEDLRKGVKASTVASKAIETGVSAFFDQNRIKVASLDDLFAFSRVDDKHLVHKSTQDLWSIESGDDGDVHITRLFEAGKPVKG
jgi:Fe-S-cluster containining protein